MTIPSHFIKLFVAFLLPLLFSLGCSKSSPDIIPEDPAARNPSGAGPAPVNLAPPGSSTVNADDLRASGNYVILAKTGITTTGASAVTGHLGVSPVAASYITGFGLVLDPSTQFATSSLVLGGGKVYAADYGAPTPSTMTSAIGSMETAYNSAAGRTLPDFTELGAGNIGGLTLVPGLYNWSSSVSIPTDVTLNGASADVWIFQVAGNLVLSAGKSVTLTGGALAKNVFWQVAGQVVIHTTAHFEGIILTKTAATLNTNSSLNGRIFAQTAVALDAATLTQP